MYDGPTVSDDSKYDGTWTHGVDGAFNDARKERFALMTASGKPVPDAALDAGVSRAMGMQWAGHRKMKARKHELRAQPAVSQTFCVSVAMICADLYKNSVEARKDGEYTASNASLVSLYKIAKQEKSLLESFDAEAAPGHQPINIVQAMNAHLSANRQKVLDSGAIDADGDSDD